MRCLAYNFRAAKNVREMTVKGRFNCVIISNHWHWRLKKFGNVPGNINFLYLNKIRHEMSTIGNILYDNKIEKAMKLFKIVIASELMYVKFKVFVTSFSVIKSKFRG